MRYVRKEHIITTICNEDVMDDNVISGLLSNLKENRIEFSLSVRKFFPSLHDYKNTYYSRVKVKNTGDTFADFLVFDKSSTTHLSGISFSDIIEINAITMIDKILKTKIDPTRFDLLDIVEE